MTFNADLIRQRAKEIRNALAALAPYRILTREEFLSRAEAVDAAKYRLVVAIEAAISICNHLAARLAQRVPESYAECFDVLSEVRVVAPELASKLTRMARFRNLLVHLYWQVDDGRVWEILQGPLDDLDTYLEAVGAYTGQEDA